MIPFAVPGDSGALVLDLATGNVVGVVSAVELCKSRQSYVATIKPNPKLL